MHASLSLRAAGLIALVLALPGCNMAPPYVRPAIDTGSAYKESATWKAAEPRDTQARGAWWEAYGDEMLNGLQQQVETAALDLRTAATQYRQAQALADVARAAIFPEVGAGLSVTRSKPAERTSVRSGANTDYALRASTSWELDLWGRLSNAAQAASASAQAASADVAAVRLSLQAALAQTYLMLRVADSQQRLLDALVADYGKTLQLTQNHYTSGVVGKTDVLQAQTQLKLTQAQALDFGMQRAQLEHSIAVLLGKPPSTFNIAPAPLAMKLPDVPAGLPSELLERRPDIAAAERRAAAANAQIGVARAALFPSLTLSVNAGFQNEAWTDLISTPSRIWSLGPQLAHTLFDSGLRRAQVDSARAGFDLAADNYRKTVLTALQEVEDNLVALRVLEQEERVQLEAVAAAQETVRLTLNQYQAGTVSYINVVTTQASALSAERGALDIRSRRYAASIALVKALGGPWPDTTMEVRTGAKQ